MYYTEWKHKEFSNGCVYALKTPDGYPVEITDTFLPYYTKDAASTHENKLHDNNLGSRQERWMVGVSTQSGCPVRCKFCATGKLPKWRNLTTQEIMEQVNYILKTRQSYDNMDYPRDSKEFKINYTRMGEPFLNIENVKSAIYNINDLCSDIDGGFCVPVHHYISTIGIKDSNFNWIRGNITLQISLHSLDEERRNWLIPWKNKMTIKELGQIRTKSNLKTTVNLTLVDEKDFDIEKLKEYFDPKYFFIKLSPINENCISEKNELGKGIIEQVNLI